MTTKITKEFLKETIEKALEEYTSDEVVDLTEDKNIASNLTKMTADEKKDLQSLSGTLAWQNKARKMVEKYSPDTVRDINDGKTTWAAVWSAMKRSSISFSHVWAGENEDKIAAAKAARKSAVTGGGAPTTDSSDVTKENTLYEQRFGSRNSKLFEKLKKEWTK